MTTITNEQAWREWHRTSPQEVQPGIARIPLTLHMDGLKAVNVYALTDGDGVTLVDGGLALDDAEEELVAGLASIGAGLGDIRRILVTHFHRDHYTLAARVRSRFGTTVLLGEGERAGFEDMLAKAPPPEIPQTPYLRRSGAPTHVVDALRRMGANIDLSVWTRPKLRLVDVANPLLGRGFAGLGVGGSVYLPLMVRGMGAFRRAKVWRWVGVGSARVGTRGVVWSVP